MKEWTDADERAANREGWLISNSSEGWMEVQKVDDCPLFATDAEAIAFVYRRAVEGSSLHARALAFTVPNGPRHQEYRVAWRIDLTSTSPEAAAKLAESIFQDSDRVGNIYEVTAPGELTPSLIQVVDGRAERVEH